MVEPANTESTAPSHSDFSGFGFVPELVEAISYMGFKQPTPIQQMAIPIINSGKDLIGCAQTGTGKTGAFLLPLINRLMATPSEAHIRALIVVPTRELAVQIDQQCEGMSYGTGIHSFSLYGGGAGDDWDRQKRALNEGADIIIATPGKLISHLNMGYGNFSKIEMLILDEADRMLDIGFHEDILKIISMVNPDRQTLMFSATMPPKIRELAKVILKQPEEISLAVSKPAAGVKQGSYLVFDDYKGALVRRIISERPDYDSIIVFSGTKQNVRNILRAVSKTGSVCEGISSDLEQSEREAVMNRFRNREIRILVATDVISRGIDVKDINLVINFNVPMDPEDYVHRIGRTARAATKGEAITFINPDEMRKFARIEKLIEKEVEKLNTPTDIGPSPAWEIPQRKEGGGGGGRNKRKGGFQSKRNGNNPNK
jgi:superfamily II DNA/RNA helicase